MLFRWSLCHSELFRCLWTAAERSEVASQPSLRGRSCAARSDANTHTNVSGHVESAWFCHLTVVLSLNSGHVDHYFMSRIDYLHAFWMICHSELFRCLCTAAERSEAASRPSLRGRPCAARSNANTHTPCSNFWTVTKCSRPCGECSIQNCFAVSKLPLSAARRQASRACEADHVWRVATQTHTHTTFSACLLDDLSYSYNCLRTCAKCCILSLNCRSLN